VSEVRALERVFLNIQHTRMQGLDELLNPMLQVEAVGFRAWQGWQVGVLITPWFMNLMILPDRQPLPARPEGDTAYLLELPEGAIAFLFGHESELGDYLMCSLFSPVKEFADQDTARLAAQEVLKLLFTDRPAEPVPDLSRRRFFGLRG